MNLLRYADSEAPDQRVHLRATLSAYKIYQTLFYRLEDSLALRSDCMDVQCALELHCLHMSNPKINFGPSFELKKKFCSNSVEHGVC